MHPTSGILLGASFGLQIAFYVGFVSMMVDTENISRCAIPGRTNILDNQQLRIWIRSRRHKVGRPLAVRSDLLRLVAHVHKDERNMTFSQTLSDSQDGSEVPEGYTYVDPLLGCQPFRHHWTTPYRSQ